MSNSTGKPGFIYILSHPSMEGLVMVGKARNFHQRVKDYASHSMLDYVVEYVRKVEDINVAETAVLRAMGEFLLDGKSEAFRVSVADAIWFVEQNTPDGYEAGSVDLYIDLQECKIKIKERNAEYRRLNREKIRVRDNAYYWANRDWINAKRRKRYADRKQEN